MVSMRTEHITLIMFPVDIVLILCLAKGMVIVCRGGDMLSVIDGAGGGVDGINGGVTGGVVVVCLMENVLYVCLLRTW